MTAPEPHTAEQTDETTETLTTIDPAEALVEEVSIDGMCGVY